MEFNGYLRKNGVGIRNYVGIMATVGCSADVVQKIAQSYPKVKPIVHHQGCAQTPPDIANVENVLINVALNPNLFSVLLVNLGCESTSLEKIADAISKVKDVETITIEERGMSKAISKGLNMVKKMYAESKTAKREKCDISELKLAIKCGASDTTSGIISNPVAGKVADRIVELGGTVLFGEIGRASCRERV